MFKVPNQYRDKKHPVLPTDSSWGNNGFFIIPHYRIKNYEIRVQASDGMGWEHVSITIAEKGKKAHRCPIWEEMCWIKDYFWDETDCVIQFHPPKIEHVNIHKFCLHLWRPTEKELPVPLKEMVGW